MLKTRMARPVRAPSQKGMMLIESLVAIMIIVLGILGIAGLTARSVTWAGQAQYRTEAGIYAAQIVQTISLKVDRSTPQTLAASLLELQHMPDGGVAQCSFSGTPTSNSELDSVLSAARGAVANVHGLPGALAEGQQVLVNTTGGLNQVTVTLCWQAPHDTALRNYQIQAYVH